MRYRVAAALGSLLLLASSADPMWRPMPRCQPQGLARCLAVAADALPIEGAAQLLPLSSPPNAEVVHYIELANKLTGNVDALRERRVYTRTPALDDALAWLHRNARISYDFLDLGWLYLWVGDSVDAWNMFMEAARLQPVPYRTGMSPTDGLLRLGLLDNALSAARSMQDENPKNDIVARRRPAALGSVALALFSAGRKDEAAGVLAEAYRFADGLLPGRTLFGFGAEVDAAKFEAYGALVPVQIALGDQEGAARRARDTEAFRLAKFEDRLLRADILHRTGARTEALRELAHILATYSGPPERAGQFEVSYEPDIAAAFASAGTLDGGLAIMAAQDEELKNRFGVLVLDQRKNCARAPGDAVYLAGKLLLPSASRLQVEAAAECAQAGDEARASKLLEWVLDHDGAISAACNEEIARWAFALRRGDLVERTVLAVLQGDGTPAGVQVATLRRAAAMSSEYLDNPSRIASGEAAVFGKQPNGL